MPDIFEKRIAYKPFEYPEVVKFTDVISQTYWVHSELDFTADKQDFQVHLSDIEKSAVKNAMLAISQIEVAVKSFWGKVYDYLPKPEINGLGSTFAECYRDGTEVLTPNGWIGLDLIEEGDDVVEYDQEILKFTKVIKKIENEYSGPLYHFHSNKNQCFVTPNHDMVYYDMSGTFHKERAVDFVPGTRKQIPYGGVLQNEGLNTLSDMDRLKIAIQADGCNLKWTNLSGDVLLRGKEGGYTHTFGLTKKRKQDRLEELLNKSGIEFKKTPLADEEIRYSIKFNHNFDYKNFDWINLADKTSNWCNEFVQECIEWDGFRTPNDDRYGYSSTNKNAIDIVQTIAIFAGYRTSIGVFEDNRKESYKTCYKLNFRKNNIKATCLHLKKDTIEYSGKVYCITVPSGAIITRYNNDLMIAGNCEFRHSQAYSRLLEVIDSTDDFEKMLKVPQIRDRVEFLSHYLKKKVGHEDKRAYAFSLIVFSLFIENVSLFSQFAIILAFTRFKGLMKNVSNVIAWTSRDEILHSSAGIYLFNKIVEENPDILNEEMKEKIYVAAKKSIEVESSVLDWIFENGEIDICTKDNLICFMKDRINKSMKTIGLKKVFDIDKQEIKKMKWFDEETNANAHDDFFAKRPVDYSKYTEAVSAESLF